MRVGIDRASADDTCRPGHAQTIFVSPSAEGRRGRRGKERQTRWCNRDDRVRSTHTESPSARVKTLQGQTSAHRYEDLV